MLIGLSTVSFAQIGIGTELPDISAIVDISSPSKGILIPQLELSSLFDIKVIEGEHPKEGLLIYNLTENDSENLDKGFYYWSETKLGDGTLKKSWVKVMGSSDNIITNPLDTKAKMTLNESEPGNLTQSFTFLSDTTNESDKIQFKESLTQLKSTISYIDYFDDGTTAEREAGVDRDFEKGGYVSTRQKIIFTYLDETGGETDLEINELVGDSETVTTLRLVPSYNGKENDEDERPVLIYDREDGESDIIELSELMKSSEMLTRLRVDETKGVLIYHDEEKVDNEIDISPLLKQPWEKSNKTGESIGAKNGEDIYTKGWVGIGYDSPSAAPNEKLRVRGSITAVNSYYADYVFENYYTGGNTLKYDYTFKSLETTEEFIRRNHHLPGVTPIAELEKVEEGYSFNISKLSIELLEKTEEVYLHIIEQQKEIKLLKGLESKYGDLLDEFENLKSLNKVLINELHELKDLLKSQIN